MTLAAFLESHSSWIPCQKWPDCPKNAPNRTDNAGVMAHSPRMISLIIHGETPIVSAIASGEIPMGLRYSSARISPGVIGFIMATLRSSAGDVSMVINDSNLVRAGIRPAKDNPPLVINPDGMEIG